MKTVVWLVFFLVAVGGVLDRYAPVIWGFINA